MGRSSSPEFGKQQSNPTGLSPCTCGLCQSLRNLASLVVKVLSIIAQRAMGGVHQVGTTAPMSGPLGSHHLKCGEAQEDLPLHPLMVGQVVGQGQWGQDLVADRRLQEIQVGDLLLLSI